MHRSRSRLHLGMRTRSRARWARSRCSLISRTCSGPSSGGSRGALRRARWTPTGVRSTPASGAADAPE